jgi:GTP 3',8-cyclase
MLTDSYNRKIDYLRLSITDRCNLRCIYCMPEKGIKLLRKNEILNFEEIVKTVQILAELGIKKIRITGGEPLIREDFLDLIRKIKEIEGIEDMALTTNGIFLSKYLKSLYDMDVKRINISLDSMDPVKYKAITRGGEVSEVLKSILDAISMGFNSLKINTVLTDLLDSRDILNFIDMAFYNPVDVRFIEMMPVENSASVECGSTSNIMNSDIKKIKRNTKNLVKEIFSVMDKTGKYYKVRGHNGYGPAVYYKLEGSMGKIGFILNDKSYCRYCNKIRLTPKGTIKLCLFSNDDFDIKSKLRSGTGKEEIKAELINFVKTKPKNRECIKNFNEDGAIKIPSFMNQIGG